MTPLNLRAALRRAGARLDRERVEGCALEHAEFFASLVRPPRDAR